METQNVVIIGSGPAGYTAAIYAARANLSPTMIAGLQPGGQLTLTSDVENWPGEADGVLGPELMEKLKKQALRFGTEFIDDVVTEVIGTSSPFTIKTATRSIESKTVIIATGASAMWLGVPGEERLQGRGVSACATCDGFFFRGKEIVVVGGGDTAMEEATFLTRFANKVTIVHRRDEFRASAIMLDRAKKDPKISFLTNKIVEEIIGDTTVTAVRLKDAVTGEVSDISTQGVFLAIGHKPNTEFLKGFIDLDAKNYIVIKRPSSPLDPQTETSVSGVFAAGDCVDPRYRQAVVAAGQGCMAAMDAERWLER